jgi:cytochrome c551/c552
LAAALGGFLNGSATAVAGQIPVIVASHTRLDPPVNGSTGLFVPGEGPTISRADALAALERGKTEQSLLGGHPKGKVKIRVQFGAPRGLGIARYAILVQLPPPGEHSNSRRYPVLVVGRGYYHGILTSSSTRIPGLVTIGDITETAVALSEGREPPLHWKAGTGDELRRLERRLTHAHDYRTGGMGAAVGLLATLGAVAYLLRSRPLSRAATVVGAAAVIASLIVSATGAERTTLVLLALAGTALALTAAGALLPRTPLVVAALTALLVVLALDTALNSFGPLGPHPETGTRFYGLSNIQETLLLAPVLAAAAGPWLVLVAALALVTVGWSHAGADGGGLLVFAVALGVLWLRLRAVPLTGRRLAVVAAAAVALGLALVGLDAALGGSSHVTHAVGSGSVFDDVWNRWRLSWKVVTSSWYKAVLFLAGLVGLGWLASRRPRPPTVDAAIVATLVSLVVNDTPVDVLGIGALGGLALLAWERTRPSVDSRPMRRPLLALPLLALVVAGCGSEGTVRAVPETVVGTVKAEAPGKAIFTQQGCNGCHTYQPAGATATVGPDLDKLPEYAKKAKKPLDAFVRESIVKPAAYVEKGYPNVMPKQYASLPKSDLDALVQFLTKPQG